MHKKKKWILEENDDDGDVASHFLFVVIFQQIVSVYSELRSKTLSEYLQYYFIFVVHGILNNKIIFGGIKVVFSIYLTLNIWIKYYLGTTLDHYIYNIFKTKYLIL